MNGIILVNKPRGWTAHDVCNYIKRKFSFEKVGHAGTLDPHATGVMVILINRATKQAETLLVQQKAYRGIFELGKQSDSYDAAGALTETRDVSHVTGDAVRALEKKFQGDVLQVPPMVSAIKKNGVPLYKLARAGTVVERPPRPVTIYEFRIEHVTLPYVHFYIDVSKGFYVRSLAHDIGQELGCGALLAELCRVRCGTYTLEECVTIDTIKKLRSVDELRQYVGAIVGQ